MTKTDEELKKLAEKQLKVIRDILIFAKECIEYSLYLDNPDTIEEYSFIINSPSYSTFKFSTGRCSVIELLKLYGSNTNKYNIIRLSNDLINGSYGKTFSENEDLKKWPMLFDEIKPIIIKCKALRDKAYAHTDDLNSIKALEEVYYSDIQKLVDISERFIGFIYNHFFSLPFSIDTKTKELRKNTWILAQAKLDEESW